MCAKHCSTAFMKHELPRLLKPAPTPSKDSPFDTAPSGEGLPTYATLLWLAWPRDDAMASRGLVTLTTHER